MNVSLELVYVMRRTIMRSLAEEPLSVRQIAPNGPLPWPEWSASEALSSQEHLPEWRSADMYASDHIYLQC